MQALLAILDGTAEATAVRADSNDYASSSIPPTTEKQAHKVSDSASTVAAETQDSVPSNSCAATLAEPADRAPPEASLAADAADRTASTPATALVDVAPTQGSLPADSDLSVMAEVPVASGTDNGPPSELRTAGTSSTQLGQKDSAPAQVVSQSEATGGETAAEPTAAAKAANSAEATDTAQASDAAEAASTAEATDIAQASDATAADADTNRPQCNASESMPEVVQTASSLSAVRPQPAEHKPAAAAAENPDCITNPLYEEPSMAQLQPSAVSSTCTAQQPAQPVAADMQTHEPQPTAAVQSMLVADTVRCQHETSSVPSPALTLPAATSAPTTASSAIPEAADPAIGADTVPTMISNQSARTVDAASDGDQRGAREPTPEDVANLGKAVAVVQARSCQLSPSLLTLQNSADMGSPAHDAFERGKPLLHYTNTSGHCGCCYSTCNLHC